ncbi:unnamed protein product [Fraxinus pennsylvanica]|uniref:Uncharacterized protein n=1 Tax=Fraxinus pennsylvanica TaxID=56036 RepID=A0AAD2DQ11_9LAMI|nr:unnamed protein product [Fraxinus pennsylvanica]
MLCKEPETFSAIATSSIFRPHIQLNALYLAVLFTPTIAMAPFANSFGPQFRKLMLQAVHQTLERAGPAFIKWGQWAAARPDLFPRDLCIELAKLQAAAPEHKILHCNG